MKLGRAERGWVKKSGMKYRRANPVTDGIEKCISQRRSAEKGWGQQCGMHYRSAIGN
jgi:hypothetical protein